MTLATTGGRPGGALERVGSSGGSLADVVETVLDKGVVIDAQVVIAVVGIQILEINARIVIASVDTYLRFAEAVDRLSIVPKNQKGLPELVEGTAKAAGKAKAIGGIGRAAREISDAVVDSLSDRGRSQARPRRRRQKER
ncbi:gas vesicle protein GvpJ [Micromonospora sp. NPDC003776]